jgi:uroporphyrinogen decarboxylase
MYREYLHPRYTLLWGRAKELADVKVMLHCCGGVYPLLSGLIEAGLDIIQPVQTNAKDMEPERLKRDFGADLCFWGGGCDTQWVLPHGTPEDVANDVRRNVSILAPGGGFVFQQVHNILSDVPPQNIEAMLNALRT